MTDQTGTTHLTTMKTSGTSTTDQPRTTEVTIGPTEGISTHQSDKTDVTTVQLTTTSTNPPTQPPSTAPTNPPTNPATQPTTEPTVSTVEPLKCQNGGTFNGYNCTCPIGLNGTVCEYVIINVEPGKSYNSIFRIFQVCFKSFKCFGLCNNQLNACFFLQFYSTEWHWLIW